MPEKRTRGRPKGIPMSGTYGDGVRTVPVRVPESWKPKISQIINDLPELVAEWRELCDSSPTSPRYQKVRVLLEQLEDLIA